MLETRVSQRRAEAGLIVFFVLAVLLIFYVKWDPYFHKAFVAAAKHTLGPSIISGKAASPPAFSWQAAWSYAVAYFQAIWQALVAGLVLGASVQVLVPRDWLVRLLGKASFGGVALAAAAAVPSMMCTCCGAPLAVGLRRQNVAPGAVLAYWLGNPVLNPATIVFLGFVLGWGWALLRIAMGLALVLAAAYLGNRWAEEADVPAAARKAWDQGDAEKDANLLRAWGKAFLRLVVGLVPEYVVIVLVLGAARAWLFPAMSPALGGSFLLFLGLALAGTLFVIPTAGEVPILQTLLGYGLGPLGAGALMITLPAVSLPSLVMVGQALPWRLLAWVAVLVFAAGVATGLLALAFHL